MKAIHYEAYGDASVYQFGDVPDPTPGDGELLVRVRAAGMNPIDWKLRDGELKPTTILKSSIIPGRDVAGEVVAVGDKVTRFKVGDRVFGMLAGIDGGYAELATLPADVCAPIPANVDFVAAGATPLAALTALQALRDHGELVAGERVLVNGASGGVGTFAVQIARALGAGEVVGVCSSANVELVRSLGVDRVIDYDRADFTAAEGAYDVIFDAVGKRTYAECKPALTRDGRYVTTLPDPKQALGYLTSIFTERKMRTFLAKDRGDDLAEIAAWLASGAVRPVIDRTFALADAAEASRYAEDGHARGKVVLTVA